MKTRSVAVVLVMGTMIIGCKPKPEPPSTPADSSLSPAPAQTTVVDREWVLVQIGDNTAPVGNGGNPVTLTLQSSDNRAFGNAGCNRYSGPYTLAGNQLTFGPAISTKMACNEGMEVETALLGMLPNVKSFTMSDSILTLTGDAGPLARFR